MNIQVDQETCIGCGLCVSTAPEIYQLNAEGKAETVTQPTAADEGAAREAAEACPVFAISVE